MLALPKELKEASEGSEGSPFLKLVISAGSPNRILMVLNSCLTSKLPIGILEEGWNAG